jgi:G3E family GTPase
MCIFCERAAAQLAGGLTPAQKRAAEQCEKLQESRVKATILTGFLGAGKTTFLNFVLKSLKHGQRIAVVQNEFGSVSVDDQLMPVESSSTEVITMPNGCLCCRVRGDLVDALQRLAAGSVNMTSDDTPLDGLIIECSGLSEVTPVAQTFFADPFVQAGFRLDGIVCVCDAGNFDACTNFQGSGDVVKRLLHEQLGLSDVVLLNKCDLVDSVQRDGLAAAIRSVNPSAKVVPCRQGKVNLQQVLKIGSFSLESALSLDAHFLGSERRTRGKTTFCQSYGGDDGKRSGTIIGEQPREHAHKAFGSLGIELDEPIDLEAFKAWMRSVVEDHGESLVRIKGVLQLPTTEASVGPQRAIVQGVGGHIEVGEAVNEAGTSNRSRLVFIGRLTSDLEASLNAGFAKTVASAVAEVSLADTETAIVTDATAKM